MRRLSATELLEVWERGLTQPRFQWALELLAVVCPEAPHEALAELSIGERDARLLELREWTFGSELVGRVNCPACDEALEMSFSISDMRMENPAQAAELFLGLDGYEVQFRLPNSRDLELTAKSENVAAGRRVLLEQCIVHATRNGDQIAATELPADILDAVVARMAQADPRGDIQLAMSCPTCSHAWQVTFDIASFLWSEVNSWAQRTLCEIHLLASRYHWCEADILALSPLRRVRYLEMIGA